ncbi:dihydrodipicolinate synthase family protein [Streptomyces sp. M19]
MAVGAVESQEFQVLSRTARLGLVDIAVAQLPAGVPVVAGVSSPSIRESIALARENAARGASVAAAVASPSRGAAPTPTRPTGGSACSPTPARYRSCSTTTPPRRGPVGGHDGPHLRAPQRRRRQGDLRDEAKLLGLIARAQGAAHVYTNMQLLFSTLLLGGSGAMLPTPGCRSPPR